MRPMKQLSKYSFGVGDRFSRQAQAQLQAIIKANQSGVDITPVWNKSYREHKIINSQAAETRYQADLAVKALGWKKEYFVDADHIGLATVDFFLDSCDFFTLDVADFIGEKTDEKSIQDFVKANDKYIGDLIVAGIDKPFSVKAEFIQHLAEKYLFAIREAGKIYRHICEKKSADSTIIEVSMDETDEPQTPIEIFFILAAIAAEGIPIQTIAPKFSGRFNKGVDYVGDVSHFSTEFEQDVAVLQLAINEFSLPENLKLSVHSGSDKFSIYPAMRTVLDKFDAGLHIKTAGTTWLEELIGLAEAGGEGLEIAKDIYEKALARYDELSTPYATVLDIDKNKLPAAGEVNRWNSTRFVSALRHDQTNPDYNLHFRQLLHVGYKIAAEKGDRYLKALKQFEPVIAENVTTNIFERHIKPLFL